MENHSHQYDTPHPQVQRGRGRTACAQGEGFRVGGAEALGTPQFRGDPVWSQSGEERRKGGAKGVELTGRSCESKPQGGEHLGEGLGKLRARARGNELQKNVSGGVFFEGG